MKELRGYVYSFGGMAGCPASVAEIKDLGWRKEGVSLRVGS